MFDWTHAMMSDVRFDLTRRYTKMTAERPSAIYGGPVRLANLWLMIKKIAGEVSWFVILSAGQ
jgi:hypothetical protein